MKQVREDREKLKRERTNLESRHKELPEPAGGSLDPARIIRRSWGRLQFESLISELEERID